MIGSLQGIVLLSAPKGQGLTSLEYAVLRNHDAYLQHIHTVEHDPQADLDGITQNKLAPDSTPAEESAKLDWIISQEPDVVLIDRIDDPRTAATAVQLAENK